MILFAYNGGHSGTGFQKLIYIAPAPIAFEASRSVSMISIRKPLICVKNTEMRALSFTAILGAREAMAGLY